MIPRWAIAFIVFLCVSLPALFLWAWKQKGGGFSLMPAAPQLKITWVMQGSLGAMGSIKNLTAQTIPGVTVHTSKLQTVNRGGFPSGVAEETVFAFINHSEKVNIEPNEQADISFYRTYLTFPADIVVESEGKPIPFVQELRPVGEP